MGSKIGFEVITIPNENKVKLLPLNDLYISDTAWKELEKQIVKLDILIPYSYKELKKRWDNSQAAVAVNNNEIISYISLKPAYSEQSRKSLADLLNIDYNLLPQNIFESATGWTKPEFYRRGINIALRQVLYSKINDVLISYSNGIGSSPLLSRLGWQLIQFDKFPFIISLNKWYQGKKYIYRYNNGWQVTEGKPYNGLALSITDFENPIRNEYYYFWTNNTIKLRIYEENFKRASNNNIEKWQSALLQIFCT